MDITSNTTTFRDYFRVIYRYKLIFILLLVIVMPITYYNIQIKTPMYQASVMMMIKAQKDTEASYYKAVYSGKNMNQDLAMLVKSNIVLERVVTVLKLHEYPLDYEINFTTSLLAERIKSQVKKRQETMKELTPEQIKEKRFSEAVAWLNGNITAYPIEESSMFAF